MEMPSKEWATARAERARRGSILDSPEHKAQLRRETKQTKEWRKGLEEYRRSQSFILKYSLHIYLITPLLFFFFLFTAPSGSSVGVWIESHHLATLLIFFGVTGLMSAYLTLAIPRIREKLKKEYELKRPFPY